MADPDMPGRAVGRGFGRGSFSRGRGSVSRPGGGSTTVIVSGVSSATNRVQACSQPSRFSGQRSSGSDSGAPTAQIPKNRFPRPISYLAPRCEMVTFSGTVQASMVVHLPYAATIRTRPGRLLKGRSGAAVRVGRHGRGTQAMQSVHWAFAGAQ